MSVRHVLPLAAATLAIGISVQGATAVNYDYCSALYGGGSHCDGSAVPLTGNLAVDDAGSNRVCAGAVLSGSFYGSYACANGVAKHCYSGSNSLNPRAHNGEAYAQQMHGHAYYSESCP